MHITLKASLILAGLVALLSILIYVTGLHASFVAGQATFLLGAVAINAGVVIWALRQTAAENGYGRQLANAGVIGVAGGVLIVLVSWLLLSVVFPDVLDEARQGAVEYLRASGAPADEIGRQQATLEAATPMSQSLPGGLGTLFTSLITGAIVAVFQRQR